MNRTGKKNLVFIVVGILLIMALYSFRRTLESEQGGVKLDSGHRLVMGTFARIVAVAGDAKSARGCIEKGFAEIERVDRLMSDYKSDSEISMVNDGAFGGAVKVSESTFEVLEAAVEFGKLSGGAFDITAGVLVNLWREAAESNSVPEKKQLEQARRRVGYEKIILDANDRSVRFAVDGMKLDLGGIAKGYAIDRAVEAMKAAGASGGLVDIGGDLRVFGLPASGKDFWVVGLQDPGRVKDELSSGEVLMVLELTDSAITTSGDYRRFTEIDGKKYSHIIDTETGYGSEGLSSVTIISESAMKADALATAVSVMGLQKGLALIENVFETEAIMISAGPDFERVYSSGAIKYIKDSGMNKKYKVTRTLKQVKGDGDWSGEVWGDVEAVSINNYMGEEPDHKPRTQAKVLYDDDFVHVIFRVEDRYVRAVAEKYHDSVCRDSCVEFFFTPGPDISVGYFNVEINCGGTMLLYHQKGRGIEQVEVAESDCEKIKIYHSEPKIVEPEKQSPTTWIIEYSLPFEVLEKYSPVVRPSPGVEWKGNFYKCGDQTSHPHWLTWNVVDKAKPDFHRPDFFGTLKFE